MFLKQSIDLNLLRITIFFNIRLVPPVLVRYFTHYITNIFYSWNKEVKLIFKLRTCYVEQGSLKAY